MKHYGNKKCRQNIHTTLDICEWAVKMKVKQQACDKQSNKSYRHSV